MKLVGAFAFRAVKTILPPEIEHWIPDAETGLTLIEDAFQRFSAIRERVLEVACEECLAVGVGGRGVRIGRAPGGQDVTSAAEEVGPEVLGFSPTIGLAGFDDRARAFHRLPVDARPPVRLASEVESILAQVAAALTHLHRDLPQILVHRDVKLGNLLGCAADPIQVRLTDFGLRRPRRRRRSCGPGRTARTTRRRRPRSASPAPPSTGGASG